MDSICKILYNSYFLSASALSSVLEQCVCKVKNVPLAFGDAIESESKNKAHICRLNGYSRLF